MQQLKKRRFKLQRFLPLRFYKNQNLYTVTKNTKTYEYFSKFEKYEFLSFIILLT